MSEPNTDTTQSAATADEQVNHTDTAHNDSGAATETAQVQETKPKTDITKTAEFKNALTSAIKDKIPQLKRQIAKELTGEGEGMPTVQELQTELQQSSERASKAEARLEILRHLLNPASKLGVRAENLSAIEKLVISEIEYDDEGRVTNLDEAIKRVKAEAPTLFIQPSTNINGPSGARQPELVDMNTQIRRSMGYA